MLPVKRQGGHFFLVSQLQDNSLLLTYMDEFKKKGVLATPYLIFTFFEELLETKNLALLRGDIVDHKLEKKEARDVLTDFFMFYLTPDLYDKYVYSFNGDPESFDYRKYCSVLDISPN